MKSPLQIALKNMFNGKRDFNIFFKCWNDLYINTKKVKEIVIFTGFGVIDTLKGRSFEQILKTRCTAELWIHIYNQGKTDF